MFPQPPRARASPAQSRPSVHIWGRQERREGGRKGEGQGRDAFLKGSTVRQHRLHGICGAEPPPVTGHRPTQQESDFIPNVPPLLEALRWLPTSHSPNPSAAHPRLPQLLTPPCPRASLYSRGDTSSQAGALLPALHTAIPCTPQVCTHGTPPRTLPRVPPLRASRWRWYLSGELLLPRGAHKDRREGRGRPGHSRFSPKEEARDSATIAVIMASEELGLRVRPPPCPQGRPPWCLQWLQ